MLGLAARCGVSGRLEPRFIFTVHMDCFSRNTNQNSNSVLPVLQQKRGMARGRNYYITKGSNKQDISAETKELIRNARNPEDRRWQLGHGIQEPLEMDPRIEERKVATQYIVKYYGDNINDGDDVVRYYPHGGEEIPDITPAKVIMVKRVKALYGEPWYNKNYCEQLGLGKNEKLSKLSFLPNIPSVSVILFKIKHLIEITPVTFPNGMPEDFDPDTHGYKLKLNGEFVVHPSLRADTDNLVSQADWMKLNYDDVTKEGRRHMKAPFKSILGHDHYWEDTRYMDNDKAMSQYHKNQKLKWSTKKK
eukprot:TRINITY_DN38242_c0_g1_i1.p1 TRINITY_DN38242_c0_g1~~TRINITY_DN38242_c0_g1_i1.p1  ORF type:complete len:305 (+),score=78.37 TRINITY_DN38242_c0_g1_i1:28-942(+)